MLSGSFSSPSDDDDAAAPGKDSFTTCGGGVYSLFVEERVESAPAVCWWLSACGGNDDNDEDEYMDEEGLTLLDTAEPLQDDGRMVIIGFGWALMVEAVLLRSAWQAKLSSLCSCCCCCFCPGKLVTLGAATGVRSSSSFSSFRLIPVVGADASGLDVIVDKIA